MQIIGAGMAGLLAAQMLRRHRPFIREAQAHLPHNHDALLRFKTDAVSRATGIPFRRVWVTKGVVGRFDPIAAANKYSFKVTGEVLPRSILNLEPGERYVAPLDFIPAMAAGLEITYSSPLTGPDLEEAAAIDETIVSTIPMPALMRMVEWPDPEEGGSPFRWRPVFTTRGWIKRPKVDLYQTLYYPGSDVPWYRISITGQEVIAESMMESENECDSFNLLERLIVDFGLPAITTVEWQKESRQEYGKLAPMDSTVRRSFILAMTDKYRVYSLGRFATWRQILLDDVVHDVEVIEKFITERDRYARNLRVMR